MPHSSNIPNFVGYTIDHDRLKFTRVLGSGSNGVIFLAEDTTSGSPPAQYAIKCMIKGERNSRRHCMQRQEVAFHKQLSSHPNVVTLHRVIEDKYYIFLVLDYCPGGDFFTYLSKRKDYQGDNEFVRRMFIQVLDALQACHDAGVYHRDIKPENFLVSEDGQRLLLTDFGLATPNLWSKTYGSGSSLYMSPECIGSGLVRPAYNTRSNDIWALGVILTSMVSGHNPWNKADYSDQCFSTYAHNPDFLREMLPISRGAHRLLQQVFRPQHTRRISVPQIRAAVADMDTFFMTSREILDGGEFLRSAAKSYYGGSSGQQQYIPWATAPASAPASGAVACSSSCSSSAPRDMPAGRGGGSSSRAGAEGSGAARRRVRSSSSESPSSTLDTDGPDTPELRAQNIHEGDIPDDAFAPYAAQMAYPVGTVSDAESIGSVASRKQADAAASPGLLRRFMDKLGVSYSDPRRGVDDSRLQVKQ